MVRAERGVALYIGGGVWSVQEEVWLCGELSLFGGVVMGYVCTVDSL